jgi:site-specific DNA-methyltransferase (adenine-specific)
MEINKIYCESNLDTMAKMPDNFIDLTITSPPYDNLRDYKGYSFPFENIAKELFRVTKDGGVIVWIVGDATLNGSETGTSFKQALFFKEIGFNIHDTMIYKRFASNPPINRYFQNFEYMFILSKNIPKTINLLKDRKNNNKKAGGDNTRQKDGSIKKGKKTGMLLNEFGIRENIWEYQQHTIDKINHPAMFPEKLVSDHIHSWSDEGDLIYDPFMGSGTTAKMAHIYKRNWIGSEISEDYVNIANKRLKAYLNQQTLF